jgi:peptidoglycan/LPS O-acetylase OafA/YrhL
MAHLGRISYAFYLWHGPVLFLDDLLLERTSIFPTLNLALTFGCSLALAWLSTRIVEEPFLRLRERWLPPVPAQSAAAQAALAA